MIQAFLLGVVITAILFIFLNTRTFTDEIIKEEHGLNRFGNPVSKYTIKRTYSNGKITIRNRKC